MKLEETRTVVLCGIPPEKNTMLQIIHIAILAKQHVDCTSVNGCSKIYQELKKYIEKFEGGKK